MTDDELQAIHATTSRILEQIGVRLKHDGIVGRLLKAGARRGAGAREVRIPRGMEALSEMKQVFPGNWLSVDFTAHGPLRWTNLALSICEKSAGSGIPATINGEPMAGVPGPVTLAGAIAVGWRRHRRGSSSKVARR
jgi:trimethylamine:corrinoid methyltransferase-like protein